MRHKCCYGAQYTFECRDCLKKDFSAAFLSECLNMCSTMKAQRDKICHKSSYYTHTYVKCIYQWAFKCRSIQYCYSTCAFSPPLPHLACVCVCRVLGEAHVEWWWCWQRLLLPLSPPQRRVLCCASHTPAWCLGTYDKCTFHLAGIVFYCCCFWHIFWSYTTIRTASYPTLVFFFFFFFLCAS